MDTKDMIEHPPSGVSPAAGDGTTEPWDTGEAGQADMVVEEEEEEEEGLIREDFDLGEYRVVGSEFGGSLGGKSSLAQVAVVGIESAEISKNCDESSSGVADANGLLILNDRISLSSNTSDVKTLKGLKRARVIYEEEQASVRVSYSSLTRSSKQKLEELMQQWSEWHAQHISSLQDSESEVLESGEQTFFPALHVGEKKQSAVSFWIDQQPGKLQSSGLVLLDNDVPLYDRGYGLGLTSADGSSNLEGRLELMGEAARCFNCGSYSHSMRECSKPRDNVAVSNARKQHRSKRNQITAPRCSTRYYEDAPAGKFDGLKPGCLDAETQKLLGLGEFDPPPWLNRMRELGYPPGYLDQDDEDEESGITIFAEEETKPKEGEQEDGEILEEGTEAPTAAPQTRKKKSVKFPGINSAIPDDADPRQWSATGSSSTDPTRHRPRHRSRYDSPREEESRHHNEHHRASGSGYSREDDRSEPPVERQYSFHYKFYRPRDDNSPPPGTEWRERHSRSNYDDDGNSGESNRRRGGGNSRPRSPDSYSRWEPT